MASDGHGSATNPETRWTRIGAIAQILATIIGAATLVLMGWLDRRAQENFSPMPVAWWMPVLIAVTVITAGLLHYRAIRLIVRKRLASGALAQASEIAEVQGIKTAQDGERADLLKNAPQLLIRYTSLDMGKVTFINDGPRAIVSPVLGPLKWTESRPIGIIGNVGTLPAGAQSEHKMLFETSPHHGGELRQFMVGSTPHDAKTTVTAIYEDSQGHKFGREFVLMTRTDGTITWQPGPVRLLSASRAPAV